MVARSRRSSRRTQPEDSTHNEARRLRDSVSDAVAKGRYSEALGHCLRLEQLQPEEPAWSRRTAYCCHRLGRRSDERAALLRSAQSYEQAGFLRQACAMYRQAVAIDPADEHLRQRVAELDAGRVTGLDSVRPPGAVQLSTGSEPPPPATPPGPAPPAPSAPRIEPGETRDAIEDDYQLVEFTDTDVESR